MKKRDVRIIKVETCAGCPCCRHDSGMGFCSSFDKCDKFDILLNDGNHLFDIKNGIHPECRLPSVKLD